MIELRVRGRVERFVDPIGRALASAGLTPMTVTLLGLAVTFVGAALIALDLLALGALVALVGSALDGLDGAVARAAGKAGPRGAMVDSVSDRIGETALWAGLAFSVADDRVLVLLCTLSLGASLVVSYMRAKAESSGVDGRGGLMGRAERVILYSAGLVFGWVGPMLWIMAILTWFTVAQRIVLTWQRLPE